MLLFLRVSLRFWAFPDGINHRNTDVAGKTTRQGKKWRLFYPLFSCFAMSHIFDDCNTYLVCFGSFVTIAGNLINARLLEKTNSFSMHDDYTTHCLFQTDYKRPSAAKRSNRTNTLCYRARDTVGQKKKITSFKQ